MINSELLLKLTVVGLAAYILSQCHVGILLSIIIIILLSCLYIFKDDMMNYIVGNPINVLKFCDENHEECEDFDDEMEEMEKKEDVMEK